MIEDLRLRTGRSPEFAELVAILAGGGPGGAIVIGGSGMGKTSLVQAAMARPGIAPPALRLQCSTTLSSVPYGALSPYLSSLEQVDDPVRVLREIGVIVDEARKGRTPPTVLVEDAQFLDPESSFVLSMLVENSAIKLIAIGSGRIDGDSTLFSLTDSGLLATIVVQPLDLEGVKALAQTVAGGRLTDGTVQVIRSMTGGNPRLVKEYVQSCLSQGVLVRDKESMALADDDGGVWVLARLSPEPDDTLTEVVREIHSFLPAGQQRTLELLALGGPQPRELLVACEGSEYRHLLEAGILVVEPDATIRFGAEVHGLVLRHIIAPGRSATLHGTWDAHRREQRIELSPQQVLWSLEVRADLPAGAVVDAVESANDQLDYPLAWKLCLVSGIAATSPRGTLAECRTLLGLGRFHSARAKLMQLAEDAEDPEDLQRALNMLTLALAHLGLDLAATAELEKVWLTRARNSGNTAGFALAAEEHDRITQILDLWGAVQKSESGARPRAEVERTLSQRGLSAESRIVVLTMLSDLCSVEGETETALGFARAAMAELDRDASLNGNYQLQVLFRIGWNLAFSGRYAEVEDFLTQRAGSTVRLVLYRQGTLSLIWGIALLLQGQNEQARASLSDAVAELRLRDPSRVVLAEMFHELAESRFSNRPGRTPGIAGPDWSETEASHCLLHRAVAAGCAGSSSERLEDFPLIEREVIALSAERQHAEVATDATLTARMTDLVVGMEGPRAALLGRLSAAQGRLGSAEDLSKLACDAASSQDYRIAVDAMATAATLHAEAGDNRKCGLVLRDLKQLLREQQIAPGPYAGRALAMAELTARETEIVELARDGRNNAEIARALTVSQRTVEGHLYRVFSKLGINDRSELLGTDTLAGSSRE